MFGAALSSDSYEEFDESIIFDIVIEYYQKIGLLEAISIYEIKSKLNETKDFLEQIKNGTFPLEFYQMPIETSNFSFKSYMIKFLEDSLSIMEKLLQYKENKRSTVSCTERTKTK